MSYAQKNKFDDFAQSLSQSLLPSTRIDPVTLSMAKEWYNQFAGKHAVKMDDKDLVAIYNDLH